MPHFVSAKDEIVRDMNDITSDFACLKVSALGKASRISGEIDRITIGPHSKSGKNDDEKSENIENEQNSCNVKIPPRSPETQIPTQSGITFSVKKIMFESELQRREEVQKEIERHWQHMKENGKAIQEHMALSRFYMAREREQRSAEKLAYILAEEEKIAEQEEIKRKKEQQLHAQRAQEQKEKLEKEVEEYRRRMKEKEELNKKVMSLRHQFGVKYCDIAALTKGCRDKNSVAIVLSSYVTRLKEYCQQMELIDEKIKAGDLVPADISTTEFIVHQIDELLCTFRTEIERIDAAYDASIACHAQNATQSQGQPEPLKSQQLENSQEPCGVVNSEQAAPGAVVNNKEDACPSGALQKDSETTIVASPSAPQVAQSTVVSTEEPASTNEPIEGDLFKYIDRESLQMYINSQQFLESYVKCYDEFSQSPSTKKFRFECQKAINIPVNAISGISEEHLRDKYERLHCLLIGKSSPSVAQLPQGAAFCKNILAKKIVSQGETLVSSKPKMAFPIAAVIVALWNDHPDFGELLLAHFHNACPFTVPLFMPKTEGQSNEDYYKSMGYKYAEDGTVEKHDKYLKRISGLMRLYVSITITAQRRGITKSHPHGLQNAWRWLAVILNTELRADVTDLCATLILDMLEVAGSSLWAAYPKQFPKLLLLLSEQYYPRMQSVGSIGGGPLVRLEEFLKNFLTRGTIPPPDGQLPRNFW